MGDDSLKDLLVYAIVWVGVFSFILSVTYLRRLHLKFWKKKVINVSRPYRDLNRDEKKELEKYILSHKKTRLFIDSHVWGLIYVGTVFGFFAVVGTFVEIFQPGTVPLKMLIFTYVPLIMVIILSWYSITKYNFQKDLNSPVFLIQGKYVEYSSEAFDYSIEKYRFHYKTTSKKAVEEVKNLKSGDNVTVEFSPNSHYVWAVKKV